MIWAAQELAISRVTQTRPAAQESRNPPPAGKR